MSIMWHLRGFTLTYLDLNEFSLITQMEFIALFVFWKYFVYTSEALGQSVTPLKKNNNSFILSGEKSSNFLNFRFNLLN